jgi:hypothetical protein
VHLGRAQDLGLVVADHQHVLHVSPSVITILSRQSTAGSIPAIASE